MRNDIGPRCFNDGELFKKKCRVLQAYYRQNFLIEPYGRGPNKNDDFLGSMLVNGEDTGKNFITREIFEYAKSRVKNIEKYETIDSYRLFNNMLSSQPMCFNLFFPLKSALLNYPDFISSVFKELFPELNISSIKRIEIEYMPDIRLIGNQTAFDAFVEYETYEKKVCIIGIETKYTDKLGSKPSGNMQINDALYDTFKDGSLEHFKQKANQIIRNVLLTESYRLSYNLDASCSIILSPKEEPHSDKEIKTCSGYFINPENKLKRIFLEDIVALIMKHSPNEYYKVWINTFNNRYLNFDLVKDLL